MEPNDRSDLYLAHYQTRKINIHRLRKKDLHVFSESQNFMSTYMDNISH